MADGPALVFVEVRYRNTARFGGALASIDARKRARLVRAAQTYLQARGTLAAPPARFDIVAITASPAGTDRVEWLRDAFGAPW